MTERTVTVAVNARMTQYNQALRAAAAQAGAFSQQHARAMNRVGVAAMAAGAATALGLKKASDAAIELNGEMANVATLMPGATERVLELRDGVQQLAIDVGKGTSDIAGGLYQVVSAFGDTADTAEILEINARAAKAGLAETTDAINLTSAVTKGYGDTTAEAVQHASDLAFTTVRLGQTTFPELAGSLGRVIPLAAALNVTQEELFGTMATFTGVTGEATEVSTQLTSVLTALMNPSAELEGLMNSLGHASGAAMIEAMGLEAAVHAIADEAEASGTPIMSFLRRKEAVTLALAASGGQADVWNDKLAEMGVVTGATDDALHEITDGINAAGFTAEQASAQWEVASQKLGEAVAPVWGRLASMIGTAAEAFSDLSPRVQSVAAFAGMAASGLGLVGGAALILTPKIIALNAALASTGGIAGTTRLGLSRTAAFMTGPWGAAIAAASLAAAAWNDRHQQVADGLRVLRDELGDTQASLDSLSTSMIADHLVDRDVLARLNELGFSLEDVRQALLGNEEMQQRLRKELPSSVAIYTDLAHWTGVYRNESVDLARTLEGLRGSVEDHNQALLDQVVAQARVNDETLRAGGIVSDAERAAGLLGHSYLGAGSAAEEMADATGLAGDELDDMGVSADDVSSALDMLTEGQRAASRAVADGFDPLSRYRELLAATADATEESTGRQADSWAAYDETLDQVLEDQRAWHDNLNTIREAAGAEYAAMLAAQGPEQAGLHAEIAAQSEAEIVSARDRALAIRDEALAETLEMNARAGVRYVEDTAEWSEAAVAAMEEEFGVAPEVVRDILDQTDEAVGQAMRVLRDTAGKGAYATTSRLVEQFGLGVEDVFEVVKKYTEALNNAIEPVITAIGGDPVVVGSPSDISLHVRAREARHEGGEIGDGQGSRLGRTGPLRPDERLVVGQVGERMLTAREYAGLGGEEGLRRILGARGETHEIGGPAGAGRGPSTWRSIVAAAQASGVPHRVTSTVRSGNPRSYHAPPGHAVDLAGRRPYPDPQGRADMLAMNRYFARQHGASLAELIHTAPGAVNLYHGRPHTYNPTVRRQHVDHNHIASTRVGPDGLPLGGGGLPFADLPEVPDELGGFGEMGDAAAQVLEYVRAQVEDWQTSMMAAGAGGVAAPDQVAAWVRAGAMLAGVPMSWVPGLITIAMRESGGNPRAINNWDINARRGIASRGLMQTIPPTFRAHMVPGHDDIWNPVHNVAAAARYILARYGSINNVQQANPNMPPRGYDQGGLLQPGATWAINATGDSEVIAARGMIADEVEQGIREALTGRLPAVPHPGITSRQMSLEQWEEQVRRHNAAVELGLRSTRDHIGDLGRRMLRMIPWTDEWLSLYRERLQAVNDLLAEHQGRVDDAHSRLSGFLAEERQLLDSRRDALLGAYGMDQQVQRAFGNSAAALIRNTEKQTELIAEQFAGLDELRARGLDEGVIRALGLEDVSAEAHGTVMRLLRDSDADLARLGEVWAERIGMVDERVGREHLEGIGALGEDLARIGEDNALSYAEALVKGLSSANPMVRQAAEQLHEALSGMRDAQRFAESQPAAGESAQTAPAGRLYRLPDGTLAVRFSDRSWWEAKGAEVAIARRLWGPALPHGPIRGDRIEGRLLDLFGMGGIRQFSQPNVAAKYFDQGGWLPPHSLTLAANATPRWEPVGQGTHMAAPRTERLLERIATAVERGATITIDGEPVRRIAEGVADRREREMVRETVVSR